MEITLVTSTLNDLVHGTDNDKKTGCGINLLKGENVTRFRRNGKMTDLKEITCDKCKGALAKKMIKADKKEMARLLKEERQREKMGMGDEGIVALGGTTAKITSAQTPEPVHTPEPEEPTVQENAAPQSTITGTGIAIDNDLAQFAINVPKQEEEPEPIPEPAPTPAPAANTGVQDDFLAQFAIQKPAEEEEPPANNVQDDFLAQFAIPKPSAEEPESVQSSEPSHPTTVYGDATGMSNYNYENYQSVSAVPDDDMTEYDNAARSNAGMADEEDIMKMFSFGFGANQGTEALTPTQQEEPSAYEETSPYDNSDIIDIDDDALEAIPEAGPVDVYENSYGDYGDSEPALTAADEQEQLSENTDWDTVANQLFGINTQQQVKPVEEQPDEMEELSAPVADEIAPVQPVSAPVLDDIAIEDIVVPQINPARPAQQPVYESVQPEPIQQTAPVTPPVLDDIAIEDIAVPEIKPVRPAQQTVTAPVLEEIEPVQPEPIQQTAPAVPQDLAIEDISVPEIESAAPVREEPVIEENIEDIAVPEIRTAKPVSIRKETKPKSAAQPAPVQQPAPAAQSVPVQQPVPAAQPAPVQQPIPVVQQPVVQPTPAPVQTAVGQVVNIPQFAGYDANNQPVYTYIQMQMTGFDANGQPVYMPLQGVPYQQPVIQPSPVVQQPVIQPAPVQQPVVQPAPVPKKTAKAIPAPQPQDTNQPLTPGQKIAAAAAAAAAAGVATNNANISKIAVHEHSRSTSQAFINAIAESKEYAKQSLTDTEGLQTRMPILTSIEDVLSEMGDDSLKIAQQKKAAALKNVPVYQEYKASPNASQGGAKKKAEESSRPLTKAELKAKKKQDKIDAKFKKELEKKGF